MKTRRPTLQERLRSARSGVLLITALGVVCVVVIGLVIGHQVDCAVERAQLHHPGSPVEALVATASDEDVDLGLRDSAVWALGQLGDSSALPTLRALETGVACDHSQAVCQRGVRKAIAACEGGWNVSAPIWRHGELAAR